MSLSKAQRKVLQDFVQAGSGLDDELVLWGRPKNGAMPPTGTWISLRTEGTREVSPGVTRHAAATSPAPGADLRFYQEVDMRTTLVIEVFPAEAGWHVDVAPDRLLAKIVARRNLPDVGFQLRADGIGFGPVEEIQIVDLDRTQTRDSRAMTRMAVNYSQSDAEELGTSIERVEMEGTIDESIVVGSIVLAPEDP